MFAGLPTAKELPQGSDLGRDRQFWAVMLGREVVSHESRAIEEIGGKLTSSKRSFIVHVSPEVTCLGKST